MRKIIPFLLVITVINAQAQQQISLTLHGKIPAKSIVQSDFIAVSAADSFTISPHLQFNRPSHHLLHGAAKAIGTGALAWQLNNRIGPPAKENGKQVSAFPAIGTGIAVGIPDLVKGFRKNSQPALLYTFYTKDRVLIESKTVYPKKKGTTPVKGIVPADGFMVVTLVNGRDIKMVSGDVEVNVKKKEQYKGGVVQSMNLNAMGDCLPVVIVCPPDDWETTEWDEGLTHYVLTCITSYTPNYDTEDCDVDHDCSLDSWENSDYVVDTYTDYYQEGCNECEQQVTVWASGNVDYGSPNCQPIPDCGGDPDPDPDPDPGVDNITDNTTDPCIKTPITNILGLSTNEGTRNLIENIFGPNGSWDIIFNQTYATVSDGAGEAWPPAAGSNDIVINLSRPVLDFSSREFASAATLHEIYHAYLLTQPNCPQTQDGQHEYMIQNFTDDIANTLKALFPGITDQVAWSLALGGYGTIQSSNSTMWNNAINACNCGLTDATVTHVNTYQKQGLEGTPCH